MLERGAQVGNHLKIIRNCVSWYYSSDLTDKIDDVFIQQFPLQGAQFDKMNGEMHTQQFQYLSTMIESYLLAHYEARVLINLSQLKKFFI
jgi:hypothetical protein